MDPAHISRLKEEQQKALCQTDEKIQQLEKFKSDYEALRTRLKTLPDFCKYDVMVPFGPLAFMPGQLIHTNEILVLLGDNWFADRSAKQASEIVCRRITSVEKSLEELQKQRELLEPRLNFTTELQDISENRLDMKEINEELTEEEEKQWRDKHKQYLLSDRREKLQGELIKTGKPEGDTDIWARLDELERIETEKNELQLIGDRPMESSALLPLIQNDEQLKKKPGEQTSWSETNYTFDSDDNSTEESDEEGITAGGAVIMFHHTVTQQLDESSRQNIKETDQSDQSTSSNVIQSPGDIYMHCLKTLKPKSILKKSKNTEENLKTRKVVTLPEDSGNVKEDAAVVDKHQQQEAHAQERAKAFSGVIVEKTFDTAVDKPDLEDGLSVAPKRVSKFKAGRQKQHHSHVS